MLNQSSREHAILQARNFLGNYPVYLDTETTGLSPQDEIVDICLIAYDGKVLFDSLVKPTISIPSDASRIHGISNEMVNRSPSWADLWPDLKRHLLGKPLAIYNADFDLKLIDQTLRKWNIQWRVPRGNSLCIMRLYAQFYGEWNPTRRSFRWQKLGDAARQCGISITNTHRAKDDTLLAKAVLEHIAGSA